MLQGGGGCVLPGGACMLPGVGCVCASWGACMLPRGHACLGGACFPGGHACFPGEGVHASGRIGEACVLPGSASPGGLHATHTPTGLIPRDMVGQ